MRDTGTRVSTKGRETMIPLVGTRMIDGRSLNIQWRMAVASSSMPGIRQCVLTSFPPLYSFSTPSKDPGISSLGPLTNRAGFQELSC